jgi:hypothetical protein
MAMFGQTPQVNSLSKSKTRATATKPITHSSARTACACASTSIITIPATRNSVFIACHATAGFMLLVGDIFIVGDVSPEKAENELAMPATVLKILNASASGGAGLLIPILPIKSATANQVSICEDLLWLHSKKSCRAQT